MWPTSDNQRQWVLQTLIKDVIAIVQQVRPWNPMSFVFFRWQDLEEHSESPYAIVGFLWLSFTSLIVTKSRKNNSILFHSGRDADWQFWLSAKCSVDYSAAKQQISWFVSLWRSPLTFVWPGVSKRLLALAGTVWSTIWRWSVMELFIDEFCT